MRKRAIEILLSIIIGFILTIILQEVQTMNLKLTAIEQNTIYRKDMYEAKADRKEVEAINDILLDLDSRTRITEGNQEVWQEEWRGIRQDVFGR